MSMRTMTALLLALIACASGGCSSPMTMIVPRPPADYEVIGPAKGSATGSLLIDGAAWNFIPIMLNSRTERAYLDAVQSVPGATGLINVTIHESWYWWVIGSSKKITVTGDAIRATSGS